MDASPPATALHLANAGFLPEARRLAAVLPELWGDATLQRALTHWEVQPGAPPARTQLMYAAFTSDEARARALLQRGDAPRYVGAVDGARLTALEWAVKGTHPARAAIVALLLDAGATAVGAFVLALNARDAPVLAQLVAASELYAQLGAEAPR